MGAARRRERIFLSPGSEDGEQSFSDVHLRVGGELAPLETRVKRQIFFAPFTRRVDVTINVEKTSQTPTS